MRRERKIVGRQQTGKTLKVHGTKVASLATKVLPALGCRQAIVAIWSKKFSTDNGVAQSSLVTAIRIWNRYIPISLLIRSRWVAMTIESTSSSNGISVLLADSKQLENQLLAGSLRNQGFSVSSCSSEVPSILEFFEGGGADVAVISCSAPYSAVPDIAILRTFHLMHPEIPKICLIDTENRQVAVQAFRAGARGLFCLGNSSFQEFCQGIERVHRGEIFASNQQLSYLLDSVCQLPSLRILSVTGEVLLTSREEQVVALVTDGLSNRNVANELGLSEHTVKKYLFRIFEKLGISSRVELVLYALHHGSPQPPAWNVGA